MYNRAYLRRPRARAMGQAASSRQTGKTRSTLPQYAVTLQRTHCSTASAAHTAQTRGGAAAAGGAADSAMAWLRRASLSESRAELRQSLKFAVNPKSAGPNVQVHKGLHYKKQAISSPSHLALHSQESRVEWRGADFEKRGRRRTPQAQPRYYDMADEWHAEERRIRGGLTPLV